MSDFPANWLIGQGYDPNDHMTNLKGRDYLNVQNRLLWFISDQRALIAAGLATQPYATRTELIELDREAGWAHFKTTVVDVLGNESVAYGSESAKDFPDYIEKAATKSQGRALIGLGYGTAFAPEMDEGERVVDAPVERRKPAPQSRQQRDFTRDDIPQKVIDAAHHTPTPQRPPATAQRDAGRPTAAPADDGGAVDRLQAPVPTQAQTIKRLSDKLGKPAPVYRTFDEAASLITLLSEEVKRAQVAATNDHDLHETFPAGQRGA